MFAIVIGEELELLILFGWVFCYVVVVCEGVGDFLCAMQWCEVMNVFVECWGVCYICGVCCSFYGVVFVCCGDWMVVEVELIVVVDDFEFVCLGMVGGGFVWLGDLCVC